jgi:hypothetical protein
MSKNDRLELRLDEQLREKLDELVKLKNLPASAVVRRAIIEAHRAGFPDATTQTTSATTLKLPEPSPPAPTIFDLHDVLWGQPPLHVQGRLYEKHGFGYVSGVTEPQVDALLTTLIFAAKVRPNDVPVVLGPPDVQPKIIERARAALHRVRGTEAAVPVATVMKTMVLGLPPSWPQVAPRVWVVIGLTLTGGEPPWLTKRRTALESASLSVQRRSARAVRTTAVREVTLRSVPR